MNIEEIKDRVNLTKNAFHKLGIEGQVNINVMLNDIEFLLKEIEELEIAFNNCFEECTSLRENFHKLIKISKDIDKKWKDKIKAKIEEVQNMKAKAKDIVFKSSLNYIETELKSLLEKE
jgi:hypothetical protein